jgi:hypothetical protein
MMENGEFCRKCLFAQHSISHFELEIGRKFNLRKITFPKVNRISVDTFMLHIQF